MGYGLEGIIPDGLAGEILDKYMLPYLSKGDFGKGFLVGTYAVSQIIAKDAGVELTGKAASLTRRSLKSKRKVGLLGLLPFLIFFFLLSRSRTGISPLLFLLLMGGRGGGGFGGGGSFGGGFGGFGGGMSGGGGAGRGF